MQADTSVATTESASSIAQKEKVADQIHRVKVFNVHKLVNAEELKKFFEETSSFKV